MDDLNQSIVIAHVEINFKRVGKQRGRFIFRNAQEKR